MDRPWEPFDRARRVLRGRDDLVGWKSADLPSVYHSPFMPPLHIQSQQTPYPARSRNPGGGEAAKARLSFFELFSGFNFSDVLAPVKACVRT